MADTRLHRVCKTTLNLHIESGVLRNVIQDRLLWPSLLSKYHTVSRYIHECNYIYVRKKRMLFHENHQRSTALGAYLLYRT
jgi:hypothetical protein